MRRGALCLDSRVELEEMFAGSCPSQFPGGGPLLKGVGDRDKAVVGGGENQPVGPDDAPGNRPSPP